MSQLNGYSILIAGPARVGKSTLINGIVGRPIARTSPSFDSCTTSIREYPVKAEVRNEKGEVVQKKISFYDTPGIENWTDQGKFVEGTRELVTKTNPICAILCFSPGCDSNSQWIQMLAQELVKKDIFVCFVVTNMNAGSIQQRTAVFQQLEQIAASVCGEQIKTEIDSKQKPFLTVFKRGLVVRVNSIPFESDFGTAPVQYIEYLCRGLIVGLGNEEKIYQWCLTILDNRSLKDKITHGWEDFLQQCQKWLKEIFLK